jgi:hypothetical protein
MIETPKNNPNKKNFLWRDIKKWMAIFATSCNLIISPWYNKAFWNEVNNNELNQEWVIEQDSAKKSYEDLFYEKLTEEVSLSLYWLTETLKIKNKEIDKEKLQNYEDHIIYICKWNLDKNIFSFTYNLSKENIEGIKIIIEPLSFLMDNLYWEWYSSILTDWKDHSDKYLDFKFFEKDWEIKIKRLSIEDVKSEKDDEDKKEWTKKYYNHKNLA